MFVNSTVQNLPVEDVNKIYWYRSNKEINLLFCTVKKKREVFSTKRRKSRRNMASPPQLLAYV